MAARGSKASGTPTPPSVDAVRGLALVRKQVEKGRELLAKRPLSHDDHQGWCNTTREFLKKAFGGTSENVVEFDAKGTAWIAFYDSEAEREDDRRGRMASQMKILESCADQLETEAELVPADRKTDEPAVGEGRALVSTAADPRVVFVVHGRNGAAKKAIFDFLRSLDLKPLEWSQAVTLTGKGSPYTLDVIESGLAHAQAVVVVLTGDDVAQLHPGLREKHEVSAEPHLQPRPNVLLEAGMAIAHGRERTVVVEFGDIRGPSDMQGINTIRLQKGGGEAFRTAFAARLRTAKCKLDQSGSDWLSQGDFDAAFSVHATSVSPAPPSAEVRPKLEGLRTNLDRLLQEKSYKNFQSTEVLDYFGRFDLLRERLRSSSLFDDLPDRGPPNVMSTGVAVGHIKREEIERLLRDIEYCLAVLGT